MESRQIRSRFIDYFKSKGHLYFPSSPLIPEGDTTLLFTSAGMVQFKPYYLGIKDDIKRATSCQKCFRTTDIDNVGRTIRHLTFFEMLGNFSFGDYFKEESLKWGYDFLTKEMGISPERLYFSYYKGGNAPKDEEAARIWEKILPSNLHSHIFEMGEENFWSMGDTGPSGPCSEIYFDRGEEFSHNGCVGPWCGCDRYIEIWNHVFTQFDRQLDGSFKPLPKKNIDTGMGLERLSFIIENKYSPFETTLFYPVIESFIHNNYKFVDAEIKKYFDIISKNYSDPVAYNENVIKAEVFSIIPNLRIISDHIRGASFLISEGVIPSNEGRGYVLRRLIRRAMRYAMLMGINQPSLYKLVDSVENIFSGVYPQISDNKEHIKSIIISEENGFLSTLENGEKYINELVNKNKETKKISGEEAFKVYETYGFPYELIKEIAFRNGISVNDDEFKRAKEAAQNISRKWKGLEKDSSIFSKVEGLIKPTIFSGYENYIEDSKLLAIIDENGKDINEIENGSCWLVFDKTPFYAEAGGQMPDYGAIFDNKDKIIAEISDVQKNFKNIFFHKAEIKSLIKKGIVYRLKIDILRRKKIAANHTATHLINAALKKVFGMTTSQAGSMVDDEKFRFDYTISKSPSESEIKLVEEIANDAIMEGYKVYKEERALQDAKKLGAVMLPGEKYSDPARFVLINKDGFAQVNNRYSLELCGGTHVDDLKEVFKIKILREYSLSRGIRRIEGTSGYALISYFEEGQKILEKISYELGSNRQEIVEKIVKLKEDIKDMKTKISNIVNVSGYDEVVDLDNGLSLVFVKINLGDLKIIRNIADRKKVEHKKSFLFIYSVDSEKKKMSFVLTQGLENKTPVKIIYEKIKDELGLKAGGRDDFMQGGGNLESEDEFKKKMVKLIK
ncbi:MAG: alanine--tRNA ligase [Elusimicrobiota bacterium]